MTEPRVGERERDQSAAGWAGAPQEGQVPVRAAGASGPAATGASDAPAGSRWLRRATRVLRDAFIAVAIMAMVPVTLVSVSRGYVWGFSAFYGNTRTRIIQAEPSRTFALAHDPSITPMQAGIALAALHPKAEKAGAFPVRPVAAHAARPWAKVSLEADMFPLARPNSWSGPSSTTVLESVSKGVSARELAYLKMVATAPLWQQYDLVARAPAVDILGARFELPFPADAMVYEMPIMRFAATKELAYAGVSRAAYYLATGQRAEAEAALRSIIGFGFAIVDNGTSAIDGLIGRVIVGIGREGLEQFYTLTGDPRAAALVAIRPAKEGSGPPVVRGSNSPSVTYLRERLLKSAGDAAEPRTIRFEMLMQLSMSSCTNVRELLLGTRPEIRDAFDAASRDLARYPSERALLDLALRTTEGSGTIAGTSNGVVVRLLVGASAVAGKVLNNPRMPFCTRIITSGNPF